MSEVGARIERSGKCSNTLGDEKLVSRAPPEHDYAERRLPKINIGLEWPSLELSGDEQV